MCFIKSPRLMRRGALAEWRIDPVVRCVALDYLVTGVH